MSNSITFYNLENEETNDFLYKFLSKIYSKKKKALVYFNEAEKRESLDTALWTRKKLDFIPHLLNTDENVAATPIAITSCLENINNADFLIIDSYIDNAEFLQQFENIYYVISFLQTDKSKGDYIKYKKDYTLNVFKKEDGDWKKQ
ncbi:MAG: hypothetical protein Ta2D_03120 [Rickettsiales bacterium]|nr:MAG: hypothetical protein Ta2D_03120 [Rickettsiales bacterium]